MTTDRDLLELAAKAAGYSPLKEIQRFCTAAGGSYVELVTSDGFEWNPLTDDGDALRLAVKLCMSVLIGQGGTVAAYIDNDDRSVEAVENYLPDGKAATRRAIVRAAAEIGKTQQ